MINTGSKGPDLVVFSEVLEIIQKNIAICLGVKINQFGLIKTPKNSMNTLKNQYVACLCCWLVGLVGLQIHLTLFFLFMLDFNRENFPEAQLVGILGRSSFDTIPT